ncbi:uncharacterized protein LOC143029995 [Oratosquilla oratoria]|uniref:uncharacterized protein LOC143029995 n=1 Tax=Oratosquilla oratoria TaxID=337810 RepID=UPI003F763BC9
MSAYQIPAPPPMSLKGDVVENWKVFENSWHYYTIATDLNLKLKNADGSDNIEGMNKVAATLCTVMGTECQKVMNSLPTLTEQDKKNPARILAELQKQFIPQRNVLIVVGTTDEAGRERLLRERPVPDLNKVIESLKAAEISRTHKQVITGKVQAAVEYTNKRKGASTSSTRKLVHQRHLKEDVWKPPKPKQTGKKRGESPFKASGLSPPRCRWCGNTDRHFRKNCPARNSKCHICARVGHYASACLRSTSIHEIEEDDCDEVDNSFMLGEVKSASENFWSVDVTIDRKVTNFKLDCGSKVTIVSDKTPWLKKCNLTKADSDFRGPGEVNLNHLIKGKIVDAVLELGGRRHIENVYVMTGQSNNLLSKSAIEALKLLKPAKEVYNRQGSELQGRISQAFQQTRVTQIYIQKDDIPHCLYTPRRVPHPLLPKVKKKLQSMVHQKVISPVTVPTEWCSGMVNVVKPNGDVRICVDLTPLNKAVKREVHPMASVDENLAKLRGSKVFTKLDANSGFWQIPLDEESRTMSTILEGLEGVVCHMDDILIHGPTQEIHDNRVREVLCRLQGAGITLNDKCEFSKGHMKFLGHIISEKGIEADPGKTKAVQDFPRPRNVTELQRFNEILAHYDPNKTCIIAADACQDGLGAVLIQMDDTGHRRPIAYASRSLSDTEKRYAVIEKEALAATWACEKFKDYVLGTVFKLETDHRPLVPLLSSTDLSKLPSRILRFRLRLARYSPEVTYVQGVHQKTADALSRAPTSLPTKADLELIEEVEESQEGNFKVIPATERRLGEIKAAQQADAICKQVQAYCLDGWPSIMPSQPLLKPYWEKKQHLTVNQGLLMFNNRIVVPTSLQLDFLNALHEGHLGITKCQG